jgi:hypothetical protein
MPGCLEWGVERHQQCSATADQGYNDCTATRDDGYSKCCTWWPCSWACNAFVWVSNIVCVAWTWVSNVVCVAWTWITTAVCLLWDLVTTVVGFIVTVFESVFGWLLSALAFVVELVLAIPGIGPILRWVINGMTLLATLVPRLMDAGLGLIGIRPEKKLRVCTVVLRDEKGNPVASNAVVRSLLQTACDIYKRDCNVRVVPLKPFKFSSGFSGTEQVDDSWFVIDGASSSADLLDIPCQDAGPVFGTIMSRLQLKSSTLCFFGAWRRLAGYGAPVSCFIIRSLPDAIGCNIILTDYATVEGGQTVPHRSPRTLGHEIGHACLLWHTCVDDDNRNMMSTQDACSPPSGQQPDRANPVIDDGQALLIRASRHASYL